MAKNRKSKRPGQKTNSPTNTYMEPSINTKRSTTKKKLGAGSKSKPGVKGKSKPLKSKKY